MDIKNTTDFSTRCPKSVCIYLLDILEFDGQMVGILMVRIIILIAKFSPLPGFESGTKPICFQLSYPGLDDYGLFLYSGDPKSGHVWISNGQHYPVFECCPVFEWSKKKMAAKPLA